MIFKVDGLVLWLTRQLRKCSLVGEVPHVLAISRDISWTLAGHLPDILRTFPGFAGMCENRYLSFCDFWTGQYWEAGPPPPPPRTVLFHSALPLLEGF